MHTDQELPAELSSSESSTESLSFWTRFLLAWAVFFRMLVDGRFSARVKRVHAAPQAPKLAPAPAAPAPSAAAARPVSEAPPRAAERVSGAAAARTTTDGAPALQLLGLLQREGRLVDFLEQDIAAIPDADVAAAARVVHEGCRRALRSHAKLVPIRSEGEGSAVVLEEGFTQTEIQLLGDVRGHAPYRGQLRHHGWRAVSLSLPTPAPGHDPGVIAPAEIEL